MGMATNRDGDGRGGGRWSRRRAVAVGGTGLAAVGLGLPRSGAAAVPLPLDIAFDILRKGTRVGAGSTTFRPVGGDGFEVATATELAIKLAFVTVFRYRQTARDAWRGGRLVGSEVDTNEDGRQTRVVIVERGDGRLEVAGPGRAYAVEPGTMTDLCLWNIAATRQPRLIDGQTGELLPMTLAPPVQGEVTTAGRRVRATAYGMSTLHGREATVWYDAAGRWVRAEYLTRGQQLVMEPPA